MNTAHNLPIDILIRHLQEMKIRGIRYVDATILSPLDIKFKPSQLDHLPSKKKIKLSDLDITDLV